MTRTQVFARHTKRSGQTVVVALIILSLLLILGFVFLGVVNRNLVGQGRHQQRSASNDLAEAGIRFAHSQMLNSEQGADWRGPLTDLAPTGGNATRDPDMLYLRPPTFLPLRADNDPQRDLGGPDGLGSFTRVEFENGRALVRVLYAPSDANIFSGASSGSLREPGKGRNYLMIESIGRQGRVEVNDPSTLSGPAIQFTGYNSTAEFREALRAMRAADDARSLTTRKLMAFASIGMLEHAIFVHNKHRVSRAAELGVPDQLGAVFDGQAVQVPMQIGTVLPLRNFSTPPTAAGLVPGLGSVWVNGDLRVHGEVRVNANVPLGDLFAVVGNVSGANDTGRLVVNRADVNRTTGQWQAVQTFTVANNTNPSLNSRNNSFSTLGGVIRDGHSRTDGDGYPRAVGYKQPPSMFVVDPETKLSRYVRMTRESGAVAGGNSGRFGHGRGVYVDNYSDRQTPADEGGRALAGAYQSLVNDWLNPNSGQPNSGWQGPFYVPPGAYVQLTQDGFLVVRDSRSPARERTWKFPDGADTGNSLIRYRIGNYLGVPHIVNSFTPGVDINSGAIDFSRGQPFNGVLYFEGNVRLRGTIPTDRQITLVSNGTIYIEGSITKGVVDAAGQRLTRSSASMLMLMAKDYVALNTTQFFGPSPTQVLEVAEDVPSNVAYNPIRMRNSIGSLSFRTEILLDPNSGNGPAAPNTWRPYVENYRPFGGAANAEIPALLMLTQTMDDGPAPSSFLSMDINYGIGTSTYLFPTNFAAGAPDFYNNGASVFFGAGYTTPGFATPNYVPIYGLGSEPWQRYTKFEAMAFPLLRPSQMNVTPSVITSLGPEGTYQILSQDTNDLSLRPNTVGSSPTNDYLLARAAIVPHDIRIEAAIFAEEGSFFVIPGPPFNPDPNDRRETYPILGATEAERRLARLENFGSYPWTPFYGEPLDVRIQIYGSISQNVTPPMSQQAQWLKRWGWIPGTLGATGVNIPASHVPPGYNLTTDRYVPNLIVSYDPVLATARPNGFDDDPATNPPIRTDNFGRALPPLPRLPVSQTLAYFGEVNP
jgi:hypothetical protein